MQDFSTMCLKIYLTALTLTAIEENISQTTCFAANVSQPQRKEVLKTSHSPGTRLCRHEVQRTTVAMSPLSPSPSHKSGPLVGEQGGSAPC